MTVRVAHQQIGSAAEAGVRNSQPEGIGRVVALDDLACWNNLGRNLVFADRRLRPRAVFGTTLFPADDEASQFDLDLHSVLDVPELRMILVLNHFGTVRGFSRPEILRQDDGGPIEPTVVWSFAADVERTITVAGRLVGSAPRSDGARGLLVSACLEALPDGASIPTRLGATAFGEVTALGVIPGGGRPLIAVGGEAKVALVPLVGEQVGRPVWVAEVGFRVASLSWHHDAVWAAGPDHAPTVDDYEWERLSGGGFAVLAPADGRTMTSGPLPPDVAWGTGGVAVAPFGRWLAAAGRTGRLHLVDPYQVASVPSTPPLASDSLGIAHLAVAGRGVVCGFNRGGYRLHCFTPHQGGRTIHRA